MKGSVGLPAQKHPAADSKLFESCRMVGFRTDRSGINHTLMDRPGAGGAHWPAFALPLSFHRLEVDVR